jgi:hypothetical protein
MFFRKAVSRRISHPLRPGMKQASLVVDDGVFEIFKSFSEARAYLIVNIDWILHHFGDSHAIAKEDVIVVSLPCMGTSCQITTVASGRRNPYSPELCHDRQQLRSQDDPHLQRSREAHAQGTMGYMVDQQPAAKCRYHKGVPVNYAAEFSSCFAKAKVPKGGGRAGPEIHL